MRYFLQLDNDRVLPVRNAKKKKKKKKLGQGLRFRDKISERSSEILENRCSLDDMAPIFVSLKILQIEYNSNTTFYAKFYTNGSRHI